MIEVLHVRGMADSVKTVSLGEREEERKEEEKVCLGGACAPPTTRGRLIDLHRLGAIQSPSLSCNEMY